MDIHELPDPCTFKYKWRSPYDFNNTFSKPHIYALTYKGVIKYVGKSTGTRSNYYTGGVIPNKISEVAIKGVLEFVEVEKLDEAEIAWIDKLKPKFNISAGGQGGLIGDLNPSKRPEVREKIGKASKGRTHTKETKAKMRQAKLINPIRAHLNTKRDASTIQKIKESHKKRNELKYNQIKQLIQEGYYVLEIVKILKVSTATVAKIKKELNIKHLHNRKRLEPRPKLLDS
jgi:hypothetical protein